MESNFTVRPYQILYEGNYYKFTTSTNAVYRIAINDISDDFVKQEQHHLKRCFKFFSIALIEGEDKGRDVRVRDTVCELIRALIEQDPQLVLLFTADDEDGRSHIRIRKFNSWYSWYDTPDCPLTYIPTSYPSAKEFNPRTGYGGFILRKENVYHEEIKLWHQGFIRDIEDSKDFQF